MFNVGLVNVFMGDVNDLLNIECLYLMDAVVSVGKFSHVDNVVKIFESPERSSKKVIKKLSTPFKNKQTRPSDPKKTKVNKNLSVLRFRVGEKSVKNSLNFYHVFNKDVNRKGKRIFGDLGKRFNNKKANVLYLVDHLQEKSLNVFKQMLKKYAGYNSRKLDALKYKKMKVFN